MANRRDVIIALKATAELYGRQMSETAATMLVSDLSRFTPDQVLAALGKCRAELRTFPTVADVAARISDGRPGVEEAWGMLPRDERDSVVWTDEMSEAFGACRVLITEGDMVAARMAFKETYSRLLADARNSGRAPRWSASLGHDRHHRATVVLEAVHRGRLTTGDAERILPAIEEETRARLPGPAEAVQIGEIVKQITGKVEEEK